MLYARKNDDGSLQTLRDHLKHAGEIAGSFEERFSSLSYLVGALHDLGKATDSFQNYLLNGGERGSVIHAWQGAEYSREIFNRAEKMMTRQETICCRAASELCELAITSHHGDLPDCISKDRDNTFFDRVAKVSDDDETYHYPEVVSHIPELDLSLSELPDAATKEIIEFLKQAQGNDNLCAYIGFLCKYVYSRLVDADRLDAASFTDHEEYEETCPDWAKLIDALETYIAHFDSVSPINAVRTRVSNECRNAADRETGVYKLALPTGAGKTLCALRFAMHHAKKLGKRRIIFVIPFLSITTQTADVLRRALGLASDDPTVLEHYSSVQRDADDDENSDVRRRLAAERWDSPIIITTMVQFLESVMSSHGTKLRKFHNMADSVIIFDEYQSLPTNCTNIFPLIVNFLSSFCGSTILLCTATQPRLENADRKILRLSPAPDLVVLGDADRQVFRRVRIRATANPTSLDDFADMVLDKARENSNCLAVVNLKSEARKIYSRLLELGAEDDFDVIHLSTSMCSAHRRNQLERIRQDLDGANSRPVICVSTQLIEAGVDLSFACVIRAMAGLNSILQAAGRCNRNGESPEPRDVYVVPIENEQGISYLPDIEIGKGITRNMLVNNPDLDLQTDEALDIFYNAFYQQWGQKNTQIFDYPIGNGRTIFELMGSNKPDRVAYEEASGEPYRHVFPQAFRIVGENFHVIPDIASQAVVVRYQDDRTGANPEELVQRLSHATEVLERMRILRQLQDYSVNLFNYEFNNLDEKGAIPIVNEDYGIRLLNPEYYDKGQGLVLDAPMPFMSL